MFFWIYSKKNRKLHFPAEKTVFLAFLSLCCFTPISMAAEQSIASPSLKAGNTDQAGPDQIHATSSNTGKPKTAEKTISKNKQNKKQSNKQIATAVNVKTPVSTSRQEAKGKEITVSVQQSKPPTKTEQLNLNKRTARAVNTIPGAKVHAEDLKPPELPPIKGFHPIKRLLRPIEQLQAQSIRLEQQIMHLEGPIASLQTPMLDLHERMGVVDNRVYIMYNRLGAVHTRLGEMHDQLGGMKKGLDGVQLQVSGAREDLTSMREDIAELKKTVKILQGPLSDVAGPLQGVQNQLSFILFAIVVASCAIAIGTPIAALIIYRHRAKIFPGIKDADFPQVVVKEEEKRKPEDKESEK